MPRRLTRVPHLTVDDLNYRYRQATDPVARRVLALSIEDTSILHRSYACWMYTAVMPSRLTLAPHLSVEPLGQCYKRATTPAAARPSQPLWLIGQGHTATAAPALVGLRHKWVHALV